MCVPANHPLTKPADTEGKQTDVWERWTRRTPTLWCWTQSESCVIISNFAALAWAVKFYCVSAYGHPLTETSSLLFNSVFCHLWDLCKQLPPVNNNPGTIKHIGWVLKLLAVFQVTEAPLTQASQPARGGEAALPRARAPERNLGSQQEPHGADQWRTDGSKRFNNRRLGKNPHC